ncbi:T9SS type A sorting domain-containing protein [Candidatus Poribacteria bacterium]|nr:T9SS type A sorting domain-containing protein [Candidatus Poribacteria bacterium]MYB01429.1 T9SS type A sorting domain-containing protein [Candidatus Poribacteria bacterium]
MMKKLFVNRKIILSIIAGTLLIYGVQAVGYAQDNTPTVAPGDTNTSLRVSFIDILYTFDENAYQIQLRRKIPQSTWITNCVDISYRGRAGSIEIYTYFHDLEPGVTYEARYRDTNEPDCTENPPSPDPWSAIGQGTTLLENPPVAEFVDTTLAIVVRRTLRLDLANGVNVLTIPIAELSKLKTLSAGKSSTTDDLGLPVITELAGLEHATQLITLYLRGQDVTDLTPLTHLAQLTNIDLWGNRILDITPLAQLTQLIVLDLGGPRTGNDIRDIMPLAQLTQLRELGLSANEISDLSPLAGLTELRELSLDFNLISDIRPLAQLIELTTLTLSANQVSDISPLTQLTKLTLLGLTTNQIKDITPLAQMKQLTFLQLGYNQIRDITPLGQAESLTKLYLNHNQIRDLSPLTTLTQLTTLDLASNQISDVTPLVQLSESLEVLDLRDNQIQDVTPLASLIALERLSLRDNPITSTFPLNVILDENPDVDIDIEVVSEEGGPTLTAVLSTPQPFVTLNGSVLTLTLSSGEFEGRTDIRDALTISGITGITFHWTDIEHISDTEIAIKLTFMGSINTDSRLIFTLGPSGIKNYNGPSLTADVPIAPTVEVTDGLVASAIPLTAANLHGSIVMLILSGKKYDTNPNFVSGNIAVSGVDGVALRRQNVERVSDTLVTIQLEFSGNIDTDSALTFTVGAKAIADYDGPALTSELPVTVSAATETPTITETATTDATVSITPSSIASAAVGEQLEFSLNITGGEAVAGYQATVQFDPTALRYVSGANGDFLPADAFFVQPLVENNLVKLNAASLTGESKGDGTLVTLTFEVIDAKVSTLILSDVLLSNSAGETFVPHIESAEITEPTGLKGDVNGDGTVNIADLVLVASNLGKTGQNAADVNGDGVVNIADLVLVAGALGNSAAAPSLHPQALEMLTATEVKQWLSQAQQLNITDTTSQRGILFLQQLLEALTPKETALLPNYPNPFNPETWIPYQLAKGADVTLHIYAVNGRLVRTLTLGHQAAGIYQSRSRAAYWNGKDGFGETVASGVYFYTLTAGDFSATRKMLIRK